MAGKKAVVSKKTKSKKSSGTPSSKKLSTPVREVEIVDSDGDGVIPELEAEMEKTLGPAGLTEVALDLDEKSLVSLPAPLSGLSTNDPLAAYLAEIRHYPLLTPEEERELALRFREGGDRLAAEKLVTSNLRFVVKIAAEYSKFGAKMIDLIQEGNVGLMQAVKEFNPHRGVKLITYAVWWIRGYIREYLMRQYSLVRLGTTHNQKKLFYNLQQEEKRLHALGKDLDLHAVAERLGIDEDEVSQMHQRLKGRDLSLDQPLDDESKSSYLDLQTSGIADNPEEQLGRLEELQNLRKNIESVRPHLNSKELFILESRLLSDDPLTLQDIGDRVGVTRERARQIEANVLKKIQAALEIGEPGSTPSKN